MNIGASAQTVTYGYLAGCTVQTFSVAAGVFSVAVDMYGAAGGADYYNYNQGGYGGRVQCTLATTPGQILNIIVGGQGQQGNCCTMGGSGFGGCNGGGSESYYIGGGGGGASDIRVGGNALSNRLVVAGGGGGAGYICTSGCGGGAGGGLTGGNGSSCFGSTGGYNGLGATQAAGGAGGTYCYCPAGNPGTLGQGGNGGGYASGGGGGGYYGGGGAAYYAGGGGGSSYTDPTLCTAVVHTQGYASATNSGQVKLTPMCTPPTTGSITGTATFCGGGIDAPLTYTGSQGGIWSSTAPTVATVSNTGVVHSLSAGTATISYSLTYSCGSPATGALTITVVATPAAILPFNPTVCAGSTIALTDAAGGTWSNSNNVIANVGSASGLETAVYPGTSIVTYTAATGCSTTTTLTVNASPVGISGATSLCQGATTTLSDITPGGTWSSASGAVLSINSASGLVTGLAGTNTTTITYTLPDGCNTTRPITVNAQPAVNNVTETGGSGTPGHYCAGSAGIAIGLNGSESGVNYQLYNGSTPYYTPLPGTGSALSFGNITAAGTYTVMATGATSGCATAQSGSASVTMDPLPTVYSLSFSGSMSAGFCSPGGSSPDLILSGSDPLTIYYLYQGSTNLGYQLGSGSMIDFGPMSAAGTYSVVAFNPAGCQLPMSGMPVLNMYLAPDVHNVIPASPTSYCPYDAGVHVGLDYSQTGIEYYLYNGGATAVDSMPGSASTLDFGAQPYGTYTVVAVNTTSGCSSPQNGSATITTYSLPGSYVTSSSAGTSAASYCAGGAGADIQLSGSDFGVNYQLMNGTAPVGMAMPGGGSPLTFSGETMTGTYTVLATDLTSGCVAAMPGSVTVSINPLPNVDTLSATNGGHFCAGTAGAHLLLNTSDAGVSYSLYNTSGLVTAMAGSGSSIDFGANTVNGAYTAVATNTVTGCSSNMFGSPSLVTDALPDVYNVTGGGPYCSGGAGVHIGLDFSGLGISYQLYNSGGMVGSPVIGSNASIDFGAQAAADVYSVVATNTISGCSQAMSGTATVIINTPPSSFVTTSSSSSYCSGTAGVDLMLNGSQTGIYYQLYNYSTPIGTAILGTGSNLDFGYHTETGTYSVVAVDSTSMCTNTMSGYPNISVDLLPCVFPVSGGGNYCAGGSGVHVGIANSCTGVDYQLYYGATPVGGIWHGTGSAVDFGLQTGVGTYTVVAMNPLTGCRIKMDSNAVVGTYPLPTAYPVTGGGNVCAGAAGVHVGLSGSSSGVTYQLYNGITAVGGPMTGSTGTSIDYGVLTTAGMYSVMATDIATGCTSPMTGTATINVNPAPTLYTTFGGGAYCAGGTGSDVFLSGSSMGINYQLYMAGSPVGSPMSGTGAMIDFGMETTPGSYTIVATDPITSCSSNMVSHADVSINPLPNVYAITGGGSYCAGAGGISVGLALSNVGVNYQLFNGSTPVGSPVAGAGLSLDFGRQTAGGTYHVQATDAATGCTSNMSGGATISVTPSVIPSVTFTSGGGTLCAGDAATLVATATGGGSSPTFVWNVNGSVVGAGSTYTYVPTNGDNVTVTLTSSADCASPMTASSLQTLTVASRQMPTASISVTPGTSICPGTMVTFNLATAFAGPTPEYWWLKNSSVVATGAGYSYAPSSGDVIVLMMKSSYGCRSADTVFSNTELFDVIPTPVPVVSISSYPGTTIANGQPITLTANVTNADFPAFQWYRNSTAIAGATHSTITSSSFANGDSISCVVTSVTTCGVETNFNSVRISAYATGVKPVAQGFDGLSVTPNPNKGLFTLRGLLNTTNDEALQVEITNMLGQVVYQENVMAAGGKVDKQIQLGGNLSNGMYILNVRGENGFATFHVVVEK